MAVAIAQLAADLRAETAALASLLGPLGSEEWDRPTPAEGWAIRDQVSHLAFFDEAQITALVDPDRFREERAAAVADVDGYTASVAARYRGMPPADLLAWSRAARERMLEAFESVDPTLRVPWYGPDMAAASALTARIMETWAHGQDVADAMGLAWSSTAGLRHVAFLGVRALPNSYVTLGMAVPEAAVRVELTGPDGDVWAWGPEDAVDVVRGPALDFCLVVTQRRHLDDVALSVSGPVADEWMSIAQAFAGPAGSGRRPGQFRQVR